MFFDLYEVINSLKECLYYEIYLVVLKYLIKSINFHYNIISF